MRSSLVDSALLEIHRFVPPSLLEHFDPEQMDIHELLGWVAKARYVQELEEAILARAIARVFSEE